MEIRTTPLISAATNTSKGHAIACLLQRLPRYVIFAGLGVTGGAVGTALAIGLSVAVQARLSPTTVFLPEIIPLTLIATLMGVVVSWMLAWPVFRIWPCKNSAFKGQTVQALLLISAFTSLVQTVFFTHNL